MLFALSEAEVEYLVVGAYALAAHGSPRATGDIDFWVRPTEVNAGRVWNALQRFGAPVSQLRIEDFCTDNVVYQIGVPPQRIDILTSITGVEFSDAWQSRIVLEIDGISVPVLGLRDLMTNKLASGRDKDLADIPVLKKLLGIQ
ncbi:MAG: DUF6036 family nucleotidyltransferase [Planctomycetota bacterium]|jgi:hypothetical protein